MKIGLLPLILLVAGWAPPLAAQSSYGRVTGRVTDSSDALIAGASVRIVQLGTNIVTTASSNGQGVYELLNLLPGEYRLYVERDGFKKYERGPIEVRVGDVVAIDIQLELGAVTESINIRHRK